MSGHLPETIRGEGVLLRVPVASDAEAVGRALSDAQTARYLATVPHPLPDGFADAWVGQTSLDVWSGGVTRYAVTDPETGEFLGAAGLRRVLAERQQVEIGYWTAPWARGRGVAGAAARALTQAAFDAGFGRVEALAEWDNIGSQRVAMAAGYRREGVRRGAAERDGERYDLVVFARLRNDPADPAPRVIPDLPGGRVTDGVVELRPVMPEHAEIYHALHTLPEVLETSVGAPTTLAETAARCARSYSLWLSGDRADMLIFDAATGAFAGDIGFFYLERMTGQGMIGYALMPEFRGRGYATRAAKLISDWALSEVQGIGRLIAGTEPNNVASQRVLERAGFEREAYFKSRLPGNGENAPRIDDIQFVRFPD